ncbi:hypothetical protein LTR85_003864 [Meristemomyces frigidus]|nr:hypothetical protein LTR85_003864 [Meristemomyces frigidus]
MPEDTSMIGVRHVKGLLTLKGEDGVAREHHVEGMLTLTCGAEAAAGTLPSSLQQSNPPPKKPLVLPDLGKDILDCIFDYIGRPATQTACLYTCKTFCHHVLPRLYKTLVICVTKDINSQYAALLRKDNPGLKYAKTVITYMWPNVPMDDRSLVPFLVNLLRTIPRGQLDHWSGCSRIDIPANVTKLLRQRQPNLQRLELFTAHNDVSDPVFAGLGDASTDAPFGEVTELDVTPQNAGSCHAASRALQRCNIDSLKIDARQWKGNPRTRRDPETGEVHHTTSAPLFRHLKDSAARGAKWAGLRTMLWESCGFRFCRHESVGLFSSLDLSTLECLTLRDCSDTDPFLFELYSHHPPKVKELHVIHDLGAPHPDRTVTALNELLIGTKGRLAKLTLELRNVPENPDLSIINGHRKTLRHLVLDTRDTNDKAICLLSEDVHSLLRGCSNLSQLAVNLPSPNLEYELFECKGDRDKTGSWTGSLVSRTNHCLISLAGLAVGYANVEKTTQYALMANTILTILNILNWPTAYEHGQKKNYYASRCFMIQRLVTDTFAAFRNFALTISEPECPRRILQVIVFGTVEVDDAVPPALYDVEADVKCLGSAYRIAQEVPLPDLQLEGHAVGDAFLYYAPRQAAQKSGGD